METIGVVSIDPWFALDDNMLRQYLIYFDKLVYSLDNQKTLEKFCSTIPGGMNNFQKKVQEIEILKSAGLIIEYSELHRNGDKLKYKDDLSTQFAIKAYELSSTFSTSGKPFNDVFLDFLERFREVGQLKSRINAILLNKKQDENFIPIIRDRGYINLGTDELYSSTTVLSVLFKKFPTVSVDTELQKFIEFKKDPDTKLKLSRLRDWVIEISKKDYSVKELEQKIDYLLEEYSKQIEIHKLKYELTFVESFVTTSLEVLENIAKLNFSKAAKVLFDLGRQNLNLLEAEQKVIGRELALIHKLNEHVVT